MARLFSLKTTVGAGTRGRVTEDATDIKGIRELIALIRETIYDLKPVWERVSPIIINSIKVRFEDGNRQEPGREWKKLSSRTIKKKEEMGFTDTAEQILVMTGAMRDSIRVVKLSTFDLRVSATDPKAAIHEYKGGEVEGHQFDPRPFMHMSPNIATNIFNELDRYLDERIRGGHGAKRHRVKREAIIPVTARNEQMLLDFDVGF